MSWEYYVARVERVIDGDTLMLQLCREVDFGFYFTEVKHFTGRFRLLGVNCPEADEPLYREAWDFTQRWCDERARELTARTHKLDSFGRWLVELYRTSDPDDTLAAALLREGLARPYHRRRRTDV